MDFVLASSDLGRVAITGDAVAQIVGLTAAECYGVVGMDASRVGRLLARDSPTKGVGVRAAPGGLEIALHVIVEYGLNLDEVAGTIRSRVAY